jgi:hypothetical protein
MYSRSGIGSLLISADRLLARASDSDGAVRLVADLEDRVEDRLGAGHLDCVLVPVGGVARLGVEAPNPERVFGHD